MTEKDLEKAYTLKRAKDKAYDDWQELITLKDAHLLNPEKELNLSKIGHGWVSTHADDKADVFNLLLQRAKARFDEAIESFRNYQPKKSI